MSKSPRRAVQAGMWLTLGHGRSRTGQLHRQERPHFPRVCSARFMFAVAFLFLAVMPDVTVATESGCRSPVQICPRRVTGGFPLIDKGQVARIVVDAQADVAVLAAAQAFSGDLASVAGARPTAVLATPDAGASLVLVGVIGQSSLIDRLAKEGRISVEDLAGRWEAFRQIVVDKPFPGVDRALVIVGSDRRGAIFGTYDLSEKAGVSPWAWWADVPVVRKRDLYLTAGQHEDAPKVKYRGFFINDEEPAFGTWARNKFGGVNAKVYAHVFDLLLRLKGNYLWPAMWGKAFAADDPESQALADARGVVMGTSHHEPMMRAQSEWHRNKDGGVTGGAWDYQTNAAKLRTFWKGGIERMMSKPGGGGYDSLITVGMRGDGDEPMGEGTAVDLLERIVNDQRRIITDVTGKPAARTPQVWALYKEVQDYYDKGMRVPDDVTLLFSDDNWGQIRRLPGRNAARPGGYGVYYHFDYVGGPRSYKWVNTVQIEKVWQQMDLAYRRDVRDLWIVNVGDIKPMELPLDFFLKMAWNPGAMTPDRLTSFTKEWAGRVFGTSNAKAISGILNEYARLSARRKPEFVDAESFPLGGFTRQALFGGEFGAVVGEWDALANHVSAVRSTLAPAQLDAFFQLVEHPVEAVATHYRLYYAVAWNRTLASANDARANLFADRAETAFQQAAKLRDVYHRIADGKWNGIMLQTHFGYTSWSDPKTDVMPEVKRVTNHQSGQITVKFRSYAVSKRNEQVVEAGRFSRSVEKDGLGWRPIANLATAAGAIGTFPQGQPPTSVADDVRVEYTLSLPKQGDAILRLHMIPTLNTDSGEGLRIAVSIDDRPFQMLAMNLKPDGLDWKRAVENNGFALDAYFPNLKSGHHSVKIWRIDGNVLVENLGLFNSESAPP